MADYTVSVPDDHRATALTKALNAYNERNTPITAVAFMQKLIDGRLEEFVAAHLTVSMTKLAFLDRFTVEERVAIRSAASTNPIIHDYLEMLNAAGDVNLTDPRTVQGVPYLEAQGLIGVGRAVVILSPV